MKRGEASRSQEMPDREGRVGNEGPAGRPRAPPPRPPWPARVQWGAPQRHRWPFPCLSTWREWPRGLNEHTLSAWLARRELGLGGIWATYFISCPFFPGFEDLRKWDEHLSIVSTWIENKPLCPAPDRVVWTIPDWYLGIPLQFSASSSSSQCRKRFQVQKALFMNLRKDIPLWWAF